MSETSHCKYHISDPTIWECKHCVIGFCRKCIPGSSDNYDTFGAKCPLCNRNLRFLGAAHTAEPFWKKSWDFFKYPLQTEPLIVCGILVIASLFVQQGFLGLMIIVFSIAGLFRYSLKVIEYMASGDGEAPPLSEMSAKSEEHTFSKQMGILIIFSLIVGSLYDSSPTISMIASFAFNFVLPASIMILSQEHSLLDAINPGKIINLISKIGTAYLALFLALSAVFSGPTLVVNYFYDSASFVYVMAVFFGLLGYFTIVSYAMMGYVLYEKQSALGFSAAMDDGEHFLEEDDLIREQVLAHANINFHEGRYENARKLLLDHSEQYRENMAFNDRLHSLFIAMNDEKSLQNHTNFYTEHLVNQGYAGKAVTIYLDTLEKVQKFQLDTANTSMEVARMLYQQAKYKPCIVLLANFHKRFKNHSAAPDACRLIADALEEGLHEEKKASLFRNLANKLEIKTDEKSEKETYTKKKSEDDSPFELVPRQEKTPKPD